MKLVAKRKLLGNTATKGFIILSCDESIGWKIMRR